MHPNIAQGFNSAAESTSAAVEAMVQEFRKCNENLEEVNWCAAFKAYEQNRKPRADIVQRFANMMGCYQATGQTDIPREVMNSIMDWIIGGDPDKHPANEALDIILAFDPLSQKGVSRIT